MLNHSNRRDRVKCYLENRKRRLEIFSIPTSNGNDLTEVSTSTDQKLDNRLKITYVCPPAPCVRRESTSYFSDADRDRSTTRFLNNDLLFNKIVGSDNHEEDSKTKSSGDDSDEITSLTKRRKKSS